MEKEIKITFWWDTDEFPNLSHEIQSQLEDEAETRIFEMRQEGYTSGELNYETDEINIRGSWTFSYQ